VIDPNLYLLKNYNFELLTRSNSTQGGGVGIYVRKGIHYRVLREKSTFIDKVIESIFIEVTENNKKFIVGSVYRPNSKHHNLTSNEQIDQFY
jgi:hypothetical protein